MKRSDVHVARANDLVVAEVLDAERHAPLARVEEFLDGKAGATPTLSWATSAIGRPSSHRCPPGPAVVRARCQPVNTLCYSTRSSEVGRCFAFRPSDARAAIGAHHAQHRCHDRPRLIPGRRATASGPRDRRAHDAVVLPLGPVVGEPGVLEHLPSAVVEEGRRGLLAGRMTWSFNRIGPNLLCRLDGPAA